MTLYRVPLRAVVLVDALVEADSVEEATEMIGNGEWKFMDLGSIDSGSWCTWEPAGDIAPDLINGE